MYEGATVVHGVPLAPETVKVVVEEVRDGDAAVPVPTSEVQTVAQALQTSLAWPRHLTRPRSVALVIFMLM